MLKRGWLAVWILGALFWIMPLMSEIARKLEAQWVEPEREAAVALHPELARIASFGHVGAWVDLLWIRAISDTALAHVKPGERAPIFYDFDLATELDPLYFELYWTAANLLSVVRNDNEGAAMILEKSKRVRRELLPAQPTWFRQAFWPGEWFLPVQLGFIYMMELQKVGKAVPEFLDAAGFPHAPPAIRKIQQDLARVDGMYTLGFRALERWMELAKQAGESRELVQSLLAKHHSLEVSHLLFLMNLEFSVFRKNPRWADGRRVLGRFLAQKGTGKTDPWGGEFFLNSSSKIDSTTPHARVFDFEAH